MRNRKETAWKKSRKFGDVKGGRMRPKLADNIFNRQHNFLPPTDGQETPIFIVDNPSRDFFFPVTVEEIKNTLDKLPEDHTENLTHIWLRKIKKKDYENGDTVQGSFICGSGVSLIVLHPFRIDLKMRFGDSKPGQKKLKLYAPYTTVLHQDQDGWYLKWTKQGLKEYFLESLLLHEIGHHIDSIFQRYWSKNYKDKAENFADNYAVFWSNRLTDIYE
ncbi:MAG: hypothetical protein ACMZ7B_09145 [Balneola sp.]